MVDTTDFTVVCGGVRLAAEFTRGFNRRKRRGFDQSLVTSAATGERDVELAGDAREGAGGTAALDLAVAFVVVMAAVFHLIKNCLVIIP